MPKKDSTQIGCMLILEVVEDISHVVVGLQRAITGRFFGQLRYPHREGSAVGFFLWRGVIEQTKLAEIKRLLHERPPPRLDEPLSMRAITIMGSSVVWRAHVQAESASVVPFLEWQRDIIVVLDKIADPAATSALNAALPIAMLRDAFRAIRDVDPQLFPLLDEDTATTRIRPPFVIPIAEFPDIGMAREAGRILTTAKSQPFTPRGVALVEVRPGSGRICGVLTPMPFVK
ncbi:MAG: hypothetical protein Q7S89_00260 [bacterium]|nr:hypothetical protein [bacterium]